jgi:hypothetical protein
LSSESEGWDISRGGSPENTVPENFKRIALIEELDSHIRKNDQQECEEYETEYEQRKRIVDYRKKRKFDV